MAMITNNNMEIPEDIMVDIMARLPVKSLLRFKCVSKSWYSHIKQPSFISKHLGYGSSSNNARALLKHYKVFSKNIAVTFLSSSIEEDFILNKFSIVPILFFDNEEDDYKMMNVSFYGPCNGIICVLGDHFYKHGYRKGEPIFLWNPSTREIKRLPVSFFPYQNENVAVYYVQIGLGFDPKSNVYKVVRISVLESEENLDESHLVEIYDLSTDCWRKIEAVVPTYISRSSWGSTYLDGFYYWWSASENSNSILTFSFEDEVFDIIPPPALTNLRDVHLVKYKKSIALSASDSEIGDSVALWVLKQNGKKYRWTKLFKIMLTWNAYVVGYLTNGKALMIDSLKDHENDCKELVLYDPNSRSRSRHTKALTGYKYDFACLELLNYAESLVSFEKLS